MRPRTISLLAMAAIVGAAAVGWTARTGGDPAGEMELALEPGRDADGRGLGSIAVDGQDVGERLVMQRLARPEEGGPVPGGEWCR